MNMLRKQTDHIVIRSRVSSSAKILITVVGAFVFVGLVLAAYWHGYSEAKFSWEQANQTITDLQTDLAAVRTDNADLQTGINQAKRQLQIDKAAYTELAGNLNSSNAQIADLRKELKFYRSIISPDDGASGVKIHDLTIVPTETMHTYRYKLVLIQALRHNEEVTGTVGFEIKGSTKGRQTVIQRPQPRTVKFRYFENIEGQFDLPSEFAPNGVKVSVTTGGKSKKAHTTERQYPWPKA